MKTSFSLKNAVFSCAVCLALFSCSNFENGPVSDAFSLPEREGSGSQAALTRTVRGSAELSGIYPSGFGANVSASQEAADGVSKTIFPASDSVNAYTLEYFVTASHEGLADIDGTVAVKFGIPTYEITLPFSSSDDEWSVTIIGKNASGKILVSSGAVAVKYGDAEKDIPLSYSQDPDGDTGSIEFRIQLESGTGVQSVSWSIGTYTVDPYDFSGGTTYVQKTDLAPGTYAVKVLFYSGTSGGGDVIYVINEIANVYSNLKTSALYGKADYASGGRAYVTTGLVSAMQNVGQNGVFLGGTGPSGIAASDDNSGTVFKPVATLQRAVEIANALAATDASKTYTINVKGDVFAGTSTKPTAQIATGAKVAIKGDGTSIRKIKGSSGSFSLTSSGADVLVQNIDFDEMGAILVSDGKLTMNDCKVQNGISSGSGTAGGITVVAGSQFVSEQGLKITSCKNTAYNGGGIYCLGTLNLTGAEISACKATESSACGGGIYLVDGASATLDSCVIGAETSIDTAASSETACSNYAASKGGGIYLEETAVLVLQNGTKVAYNYASYGGGIYNDGSLEISGATINGNGASNNGGGVYVASSKTATFSSGTIKANSALRGGGVYNEGTLCVYGSAVIGGASSAEGNKAEGTYAFGGGVFNTGNCCLGYSAWTDSSETPEAWTGSISANSSTNNAGGVHNTGSFRMISGTIGGATDSYANTAANNGGGVYCGGTSVLNLGGSAAIPPSSSGSNDIYLNGNGNKVVFLSELTADVPAAGLLTVSSSTSGAALDNGVVTVATATGLTSDQYDKCMVKIRPKQNLQWQLKFSKSAEGSNSWKTIVKKDSEYVPVTGTTTSSAVTNSKVFISGRTLTIPNMIACIHEVTQKEYPEFCKYGGPSVPSEDHGLGDNYPANFTSWYDAIVYCNLKSMADGLTPVYSLGGAANTDPRSWSGVGGNEETGYCGPSSSVAAWDGIDFNQAANGWRIPTEAEWEYMARGGDLVRTQYDYSESNTASAVGWITGNSGNKTHPVMTAPTEVVETAKPNALGIYDMTGNVWEVCWDWAASGADAADVYPIGVTTPATGVSSGVRRSVRGGSYNYGGITVYSRDVTNLPYSRFKNAGFRIVRTVE